jgi:L-2,4-diaminobutyrate transaminase
MFGSDHYGVKLCAGKAVAHLGKGSGNHGPIGHGWTSSSQPPCAAAGVADLEVVDELHLVANACEADTDFKATMTGAVDRNRFVGKIRGEGLTGDVEFVRDRDDRVLFEASGKVGPRMAAAKKAVDTVTATL